MRQRFRSWFGRQPVAARAAFLAAVVALIGFGGYSTWRQFGTDRRIEDARAALDRGDFPTARKILAECLKDRPQSGELNYLAARAARRSGDLLRAGEFLRRCEALGWPEEAISFEQSLSRAQSGDFRAVEPVLTKFLESDPAPAEADLVLEVMVPQYIAEFDARRALELLAPWIARKPDDLRLRLWQYDAARWMKSGNTAAEALRRAVELSPDDKGLRLKLADQLVTIRRADEARPHFEQLLAADPDRPDYLFGMARCERELGNTDAAIRLLDRLLAADPKNHQYLTHRGYADLFAGRPRDALPRLLAAVARDPHDHELLSNLALCCEQCGKPDQAAGWRAKAAAVDADLTEMKSVTQSLAAQPRSPDLLSRGGELLARNGQPGEARRWFEAALRADPNHVKSRRALADLDAKAIADRLAPPPR